MSLPLLLVLLALAGCGRHRHPVPPPEPVALCSSVDECNAARDAAYDRFRACRSTRACSNAEAELYLANRRLAGASNGAIERDREDIERRRRRDAALRQAQAEAYAEEQRQADDAAWAAIDPAPCRRGEEDACAPLNRYQREHPDGGHYIEASRAIGEGADARSARARAWHEREREAARKAEEEAAKAAPPRGDDHVRCCDGTLSPTCTTVHRGCCSHHGGVCN